MTKLKTFSKQIKSHKKCILILSLNFICVHAKNTKKIPLAISSHFTQSKTSECLWFFLYSTTQKWAQSQPSAIGCSVLVKFNWREILSILCRFASLSPFICVWRKNFSFYITDLKICLPRILRLCSLLLAMTTTDFSIRASIFHFFHYSISWN